MKNKLYLRPLIYSAMLLAVALVIKQLSFMVPIMGVPGLKVGFSGVFSVLPAILFGPFFGGLISGLSDVLGHFLKPYGAYYPHFTITAIIGGLIRAYLWISLRKIKLNVLNKVFTGFMLSLLFIGSLNYILMYLLPNSAYSLFLQLLQIKSGSQVLAVTLIPIIIGAVGLLLLFINERLIKNYQQQDFNQIFLPLVLTLLVAGILVTTINTFVIMDIYQIQKAFMLFYLPRLIEEIVTNIVIAYLLTIILNKVKLFKPYLKQSS